MLSVTVLLSTLELLRFRKALARRRPSAVSERAFLVVGSFAVRSGSISCLGRFVKGFSEQFFVIQQSRLPLSLITWSKTGEVRTRKKSGIRSCGFVSTATYVAKSAETEIFPLVRIWCFIDFGTRHD